MLRKGSTSYLAHAHEWKKLSEIELNNSIYTVAGLQAVDLKLSQILFLIVTVSGEDGLARLPTEKS